MNSAAPFDPSGHAHDVAVVALDRRPLVVVVDPRILTGQCLAVALRAADPSSRFTTLASVSALDEVGAGAAVLALCVPAGGDVRAACREARQKLGPDPAGVPLVIMGDDESSATVLGCLEAGARGYVPTSMTVEMVVQVLKLVQTGCTFVPSSVMRNLAAPAPVPPLNTVELSTTQLQIADWIRKGSPNKVIAHELGMSENTVKVHVRSILRKMKVRNRTELSYRSYDQNYAGQPQPRDVAETETLRPGAGPVGGKVRPVIVAG